MHHGARAAIAAELTQEAMILVYRSWDSVDYPRAWVRTVASRMWWRRYEQDSRETPADQDDYSSPLLSATEADEIDTRHTFLSMLHTLPMRQRQIMAWTYDGYQPSEIAAQLGLKSATVRSSLRAARETLQSKFYQTGGETS